MGLTDEDMGVGGTGGGLIKVIGLHASLNYPQIWLQLGFSHSACY